MVSKLIHTALDKEKELRNTLGDTEEEPEDFIVEERHQSPRAGSQGCTINPQGSLSPRREFVIGTRKIESTSQSKSTIPNESRERKKVIFASDLPCLFEGRQSFPYAGHTEFNPVPPRHRASTVSPEIMAAITAAIQGLWQTRLEERKVKEVRDAKEVKTGQPGNDGSPGSSQHFKAQDLGCFHSDLEESYGGKNIGFTQ